MTVPTLVTPLSYTPEEAARLLGMSLPSMYEALARGEIPAIQIGGKNGRWKIKAAELHALMGQDQGGKAAAVQRELDRLRDDTRAALAMVQRINAAIEALAATGKEAHPAPTAHARDTGEARR